MKAKTSVTMTTVGQSWPLDSWCGSSLALLLRKPQKSGSKKIQLEQPSRFNAYFPTFRTEGSEYYQRRFQAPVSLRWLPSATPDFLEVVSVAGRFPAAEPGPAAESGKPIEPGNRRAEPAQPVVGNR